ncbi:MAG: PIN domain-containing protein [Planctomycetaceae bacterium]|nr:MAG: PIN domain-containing protein [Planctomycetaceae bacterium]
MIQNSNVGWQMESVYLETTFISYLVARPSRDVIVAGHQQTTHNWWETRRDDFACYVSQVVVDESSAGDPDEIRKRLEIIRVLPLLEVTDSVQALAQAIVASGVIPPRAVRDAAHIATAAVHGIDYLLTWNCRHLANAQIMRRIEMVCDKSSYRMPLICIPEVLLGN